MLREVEIDTQPQTLKELLQQGRNKLRAAEQMVEIEKRDTQEREAKERVLAWEPIIGTAMRVLPDWLNRYLRMPDFTTQPAPYEAAIVLEVPNCGPVSVELTKSNGQWGLEGKCYVVPYVYLWDDDDDVRHAEPGWRSGHRDLQKTDDLAVALALAEQRARELKAAQAKADEYNSEESKERRRLERQRELESAEIFRKLKAENALTVPTDAEALILIFERIAEAVINNHPAIKELNDN